MGPCASVCVPVYPYMFVCIFPVLYVLLWWFWRFCLNYLFFKFEVGHILLAGEHPLLFYSILSTNNKGAMHMCDSAMGDQQRFPQLQHPRPLINWGYPQSTRGPGIQKEWIVGIPHWAPRATQRGKTHLTAQGRCKK